MAQTCTLTKEVKNATRLIFYSLPLNDGTELHGTEFFLWQTDASSADQDFSLIIWNTKVLITTFIKTRQWTLSWPANYRA
jgi:hypothetical protein